MAQCQREHRFLRNEDAVDIGKERSQGSEVRGRGDTGLFREDRAHRQIAQACNGGGIARFGAAERAHDRGARGLRGGQRGKRLGARAAFGDRALKQAGALRRCNGGADAEAACRFAEYRDIVRIAAEGSDVLLHPLQRK